MGFTNLFRAPGYQGIVFIRHAGVKSQFLHPVFGSAPKFSNYV